MQRLKFINVFLTTTAAVLLTAAVIGYFRDYSLTSLMSAPQRPLVESYAARILRVCADANFPPSCYDEELPKLLEEIPMEQVFEVTKIVQQRDSRYVYCHVLGHKVSYQEASKNTGAWKDVITRCPMTFCNNGCLHGALIQHFTKEDLNEEEIRTATEELKDVCEPRGKWKPVEIERSMCYHAIGHLAMYATAGDIKKSIGICGVIGEKEDGRNYVQTCTEGVFMQVFQPLEPEDFALVEHITPTKEEVPSFCKRYEGINRHSYDACHREASSLWREEILRPMGFQTYCRYTDNIQAQQTCYAALMNTITIHYAIDQKNPDELYKFCRDLEETAQISCFSHAARQLIQVDPRLAPMARKICQEAERAGIENVCWQELIHIISRSFSNDSKQLLKECGSLPAPWRQKCLEPTL